MKSLRVSLAAPRKHAQASARDEWQGHTSLFKVFKGIKAFTHLRLISNAPLSIKPGLTVPIAAHFPSSLA